MEYTQVDRTNYADMNAETIDRWCDAGWEWGTPITHEQYLAAKEGRWEMLLTPTRSVPREWFPPLAGKKVLGLASGGAQQMPIFAAQGAVCTVLDYSPRQLASEEAVAAREGYPIETVRADMAKALPFSDGAFDLIFHPVSNCYIEDVSHVWRECHRILKPGGLLLAGLDNGFAYLFNEDDPARVQNCLPFNPLKDPALLRELAKDDSGIQFSHTLDEQIRGQIQAGFSLLDLYEDTDGQGFLHEHGVPTFWATLAVKR